SFVSNWLSWRTRISLHYGLLDATVARLHRLPLYAQHREGVGAIMTRLDRGIQGFIGAISEIAFNVLPALIAALAAPKQTTRERILMDSWARIYSRFNEVLAGIVTVRSFAMEEAERRRFLNDVGLANQVV